jgi:FKBP-type peptidyl-prolyl cis-trans isomerase 2
MGNAKNGDTVKVHYTGKLDDGTVFDTSAKSDPLEFTIGDQNVIPGFEEAVVGMKTGEAKTVQIPPAEAYGPHHDQLVFQVDRQMLPADLDPEVGQMLQMEQADGQVVSLSVTDVSEALVTLDANHPLAGRELTFDLELVEIITAGT